jgi:transposase
MDALYVGIDVSKESLDVAAYPSGEAFCTTRRGKGLEELVRRLVALKPALVAVEATGGYERVVAAAIAGAGLPLAVVNPAQVRYFALALGQRAKTDPIDAGVIARFAAATKPEPRPVPDEEAQLFCDLVTRRSQITEMIGAERQRNKRAVNRRLRKSTERLIAALEKELASVDTEIDGMIKKSPVWCEKEELLASVPGIGTQTARVLLAEIPELGTLGKKSVASLAGLAPFVRKSGKWKGKSMIGGGRARVRSALFVCAMVASRHNPHLKAFHQRLIAAGKCKMVALIAVARKLLTILNAILRDKRPWNPDALAP